MATRLDKTKVLSVRLSLDIREAVEIAAVEARMTVSGYAARVLAEAATGGKAAKPEPVKAAAEPLPVTVATGIVLSDPKALDELRRIGVNINQIAHALNAGQPTQQGQFAQAVAAVFRLLKEPEAFMAQVDRLPLTRPSTTPQPQPAQAPARAPQAQSAAEPPSAPPRRMPVPPVAPSKRPETAAPVARLTPQHGTGALFATPVLKRTPPSPPPASPSAIKERRDDPPNSQTRNQLQDSTSIRPARPGAAEDDGSSRLGFLGKLWRR